MVLQIGFNKQMRIENLKNIPEGSTIDPRLLEILVCPLSKASLEYDPEKQELISRSARIAYPIRDGIPIMVPDEARAIE
jgi:uncharacterized protein YbaR (Trm112 family)